MNSRYQLAVAPPLRSSRVSLPPLSPVFSHASALFCSSKNPISRPFNQFPTLSPKHPGWVYAPVRSSAPLSTLIPAPHPPKPFRMIFFADPHHLTPIESYSCKKQGGGGTRPAKTSSHLLCFQSFQKHGGWSTSAVFTVHGTRATIRPLPTLHSLASPLFSHLLQTPPSIPFLFTSFRKTRGGGAIPPSAQSAHPLTPTSRTSLRFLLLRRFSPSLHSPLLASLTSAKLSLRGTS